jgi:small subunit ribosomal protein S1
MNLTSDEKNDFIALEEGMIVHGVVKGLAKYGAFLEFQDQNDSVQSGLVHIMDMSWRRVQHPTEIVKIGDEIDVKVLRIDRERRRISLGIKQLGENPWQGIAERYPNGTRITGKVTRLTNYGGFVEIEENIEGLVHVSDMDWANKNVHPSKVVRVGDEIEVMVLSSDEDRYRIALGIKQCHPNPWANFAEHHQLYDKVVGNISSITDFGIFVGLDGGIDGLVHISDISWDTPGDQAIRDYERDDDVDVVILNIDVVRQRISLGIKQLEEDALLDFLRQHPKESLLKGTVSKIDEDNRAIIELAEGVEGYINPSKLANDSDEEIDSIWSEGEVVEVNFIDMDWKEGYLILSPNAKEQ